jgi:NADPH:quinone reductase-like Zn-dependent oxidoreductase
MKKVIYKKFGSVSVLEMAEVPIPTLQHSTILVKISAVSINPLDWKIREGQMKMVSGSAFPKSVGIDFSGIVEAVGSAVRKFKKGQEVFGLVDVFKGGALHYCV